MKNLNKTLELPNGTIIKNRIAKSAMSENMANWNHSPSKEIITVYKRWVEGGAGLIITGNVMIDSEALGEPKNVVVEDRRHFKQLQQWAKTVKGTGLHIWPQLNHPGRQAMGAINKEIVAPSAVPLNIKGAGFMFKEPRALTQEEILDLIERYGNTALIMKDAGFTGVQIHGAHGYLVSQFLSPITNKRNDQWGGSLENRARFVTEVYKNIRTKVGKGFPIGIKINSADFQRGGFTEEESMEVVKILSSLGMDLIEISGGTYEKSAMMGTTHSDKNRKESTRQREAYFMDYIEKVRKITNTPLMLTGGFRTVDVMEQAIADGQLDIVGIARPFALYPNLPNEILNGTRTDVHIPDPQTGIKAIDKMGFLNLMWYEVQINKLGAGKEPNPKMHALEPMLRNVGVTIQKLLPDLPFGLGPKRGF